MKKYPHILLAVLALTMLFCNCTGRNKAKETSTVTEKPIAAVETSIAGASKFVQGIEITGELTPKFSVDVRSELKGLVREVAVTEWVPVRKGDLLARLDTEEAQAQVKRIEAGIASAKAALLEAEIRAIMARVDAR